MNIEIQYEIPPLRAIYHTAIEADSRQAAIEIFRKVKPRGRLRKIGGLRVKDDGNELTYVSGR